MGQYDFNWLEKLGELSEETFGDLFTTIGVLAVFFIVLFCLVAILLWVFGSIGLMNLAKKNNVPNPWLAFLPIGRSYIIGKLGFEVYGGENPNNKTFMWITFGLGAAAFILSDGSSDLHTLVKYGLLFFECFAFYNMFKNLNPNKSVVYTVFTALTGTLLGGLFLYLMKEPTESIVVEEKVETEAPKTKSKKESKETKKFCTNCGSKLSSDAKFCPECGNKVK